MMNSLKSFLSKEVLLHPVIFSAIGVVVVIAALSGIYYAAAIRQPSSNLPSPAADSSAGAVTGNGTVEAAQNPDLAFESAGRVARITVAVGDKVSQGQLLASLDTASLFAQRAQAAANVKAAQAKLDGMQAGARTVDVQAKQTAVDQAKQTLANLYAGVPAQIAQAYDKSFSGVSSQSDNLFSQPNTQNPSLAFLTSNTQLASDAATDRITVGGELNTWSAQVGALTPVSSPQDIDAALIASLAHLQALRTYADTLLQALASAIPSSNFSAASIAAAQTAVGSLRDTINTLIVSLQGQQQQLASDKLAVASAQDALNQTLAGATPQDIEAQQAAVDAAKASVASIDAQLSNAIVVAPFSGTVSSVPLKVGQIVPANTIAVSLNPLSALQMAAYFSEIDAAKIRAGMSADVTVDAYGDTRVFKARIISVETSPTPGQNGAPTPGYKATAQFLQADPALSAGMTANITIPLTQ